MTRGAFGNRSMCLDLRNGVGYALTCLTLLSEEVDHLIICQSAPLFSELRVTQEEMVDVFQAAGVLSNLKTLVLTDFEDNALPVKCLADFIHNAQELHTLRLDSIRITGNRVDMDDLCASLMTHPSLEEIYLSGCIPADETTILEPIARSIANIHSLKLVEIVETSFPPSGAWTGGSLAELCRSDSLEVLRVRGIRFLMDEDILLMAKALNSNKAMKQLWLLSCELGFQGVGPTAIAEMLRNNSSLEILGLNRLCFNRHAMIIADALKANSSLRGLHLCLRDGLSSEVRDYYANIVEENYALEKVSGGLIGSDSQVEFFLRLNRAGRKTLLQDENCAKKKWITALESQSNDVSALYYLLSRKPSLCAQASF